MDIYDSAAVQQVWQRVGITVPQPEIDLCKMIDREREMHRFYCRLAPQARLFTCMARQAKTHAEKLQAIYYVVNGTRCPRGCAAETPCCLTVELLRSQIKLLQQIAREYRQMAAAMEPYREVFVQLACEEERHIQLLIGLLANKM